jgi:hypothetical protein
LGCGDDGKSVDIVQSSLDFGKTDCGSTAIARTLVVSNPSGTAFNFTTSLALGDASPYLVVPDSGVVLPSRQLELTVYSKPVPAISAITDNLYGDTLTLTTDESGDSPHAIAITQTARGAVLSVSTNTVAFATTSPVGGTAQQLPLTITNSGNASVAVSIASDPSFVVTPAGPSMVMAGGTLATTVAYSPAAVGAIAADLAVTVDGTTCSAVPMVGATATSTLQGTAKAVAIATMKGRPRDSLPAICVLTTGGFVACTGTTELGVRGQGTSTPAISSYNLVQTHAGALSGVTTLTAGRGFFCARRTDNTEWCWGDYLGLGRRGQSDPSRTNPFATQVATNIQAHAANYSNHCALASGTMTCTSGNEGQHVPADSWTVPNATAIAVHNGGGYALLANGTVMSFGENRAGERGNSDASEAAPSLVQNLTNVMQVVAAGNSNALRRSSSHGCALETDGSVWCWGHNNHGQLGNGATSNTNVPQQVMVDGTTPLAAATSIAATGDSSCALVAGSVWCWGNNKNGLLGQASPATPTFAEQTAPALANVTRLDAAGVTTCALLAAGGVRCWGQLSDGSFKNTPTMLPVFEP